MTPPPADKFRAMLSRGETDRAVALLERLDRNVAADVFLGLPMEEQEALFRVLPTSLAAALAPIFPYFHTYVLLHTRPTDEVKEIVEKINPAERLMFFDDLPEPSWQRLMDELGGQAVAEAPVTPEAAPVETAPAVPIVEARQVEKSFDRPGGGAVQVIAPVRSCAAGAGLA